MAISCTGIASRTYSYHRESYIDVLLFTLSSTSILLSNSYISANVGLSFGSVFQHLVIISYLIGKEQKIVKEFTYLFT